MALGKLQSLIIKLLSDSPLREHFYWTGGTLLAEKYLHHRYSYDIDLFSDAAFEYRQIAPFINLLKQQAHLTKIEEHKIFDRWEFFLHNHEEVRCEFVHYNFPALKPRRRWRGVYIDSLQDLAANKLMAMVDRHEPKDVIDIYYLLTKTKLTLPGILKLSLKKFGLSINVATALGEILRKSNNLQAVQPLLFGTTVEQQTELKKIQEYFTILSAKWVRTRL